MPDTTLQGLANAYALMDAIPSAAEKQVAADLIDIGEVVHKAQLGEVPIAAMARNGEPEPGTLKAGLSVQLLLDQLKVRIGLIGNISKRSGNTNLGGLFYGVIVNFGRVAQTVLVTRHIKARRITGNGKTSKRKVHYLTKPYSMRVRHMDPREFIQVDAEVQAEVDAKAADFWANTLSQVPGADS